jgi:phenylpropionate dioxygenase-like ring-hydroxylating dioxygenase large terminal subunit
VTAPERPAALDPAALRRCLAPFGSSVGLPSAAYTSPAVLAWERTHLFDRSWVCLGRTGLDRLVPDQIERRGWAFARAAHDGLDDAEQFGSVWDLLAPWEPERLVVGARHAYEVAANWKLIHENYQECYHCSEIHPELCRVTPPDSGYSIELDAMYVAGPMDLREDVETMSLDGRSHGIPLRGLSPHQRREVGYFGIWPNLLVSPHPDYVLTHRIEPLAPDRSLVECEWLFPPELVARHGFDPAWAVEFWDVTNREDWAACESLQRGVSSRGHRPGPLSAGWEGGVYLMTTMFARSYLEGAPRGHVGVPEVAKLPRYEILAGTRADG